jgi:hypothetical protein
MNGHLAATGLADGPANVGRDAHLVGAVADPAGDPLSLKKANLGVTVTGLACGDTRNAPDAQIL